MSDLDPEAAIDKALSLEERAVVAFEGIADALAQWVKLEAQRFEKEYPVRTPREAIVTHRQTDEERARENLGDDGSQTLEEWTDILGPRERALLSKEKK